MTRFDALYELVWLAWATFGLIIGHRRRARKPQAVRFAMIVLKQNKEVFDRLARM